MTTKAETNGASVLGGSPEPTGSTEPGPTDPAVTQAQQETVQWQREAQFWQLKYFELQQHTNQVIAALSRQTVANAMAEQIKALSTQ